MLSALFLAAWVAPGNLPAKTITYLVLTMVLEFVIVHSSAFMGVLYVTPMDKWKKLGSMAGLGAFYTLFVIAFSVAFKSWWPLTSFWLLMLNRMLGALFGQSPAGREKDFVMYSWVVSVVLYLGLVFATVMAPIPRFGMTVEVVAAEGLPGGGAWVDEPHRAVALGFFYFLGQGLWELWVGLRLSRGKGAGSGMWG